MKTGILTFTLLVSIILLGQEKNKIVTYNLRNKPELPFPISADSVSIHIVEAIKNNCIQGYYQNKKRFNNNGVFWLRGNLSSFHIGKTFCPFDFWDKGIKYLETDRVSFLDGSYEAIKAHTSKRKTNPHNKEYWHKIEWEFNLPQDILEVTQLDIEYQKGKIKWLHLTAIADPPREVWQKMHVASIRYSDFEKVILKKP